MQLKFYESENFCTFSFHRMTNEKFNKAMHKFVGVLDRYGGDKDMQQSLVMRHHHQGRWEGQKASNCEISHCDVQI